jgi:hypothetical protein
MSLTQPKYYPGLYLSHAKVARAFAKEVLDGPKPPSSTKEYESRAFQACLKADTSLDFRKGMRGEDVLRLSEDAKGLLSWGQWYRDGRRVIELAPELAIELNKSDAGDLRPSDLLSKEESFYLHFGLPATEAPRINGEAPVEGAYVLCSPDTAIRIVLASRHALEGPCAWQGRYDLRLVQPHLDSPADVAISAAFDKDIQDIQEHALAATGSPMSGNPFALLVERVNRNRSAFSQAVKLILNAMAYRRYVHAEGTMSWPSTAPASLVRKAQVPGKEGQRASSKLWHLGFVPAQVLGEGFHHVRPEGGSVAAHWRRGHWRNQPHGPQLSLRKLLWIRPTLVNAEA